MRYTKKLCEELKIELEEDKKEDEAGEQLEEQPDKRGFKYVAREKIFRIDADHRDREAPAWGESKTKS